MTQPTEKPSQSPEEPIVPSQGTSGRSASPLLDSEVDPSRCPLCGQPNGCAVTAGEPPGDCWCMTARIPEAVLSRIPAELRRKACVCSRCAAEDDKPMEAPSGGGK
ncbi:cysteine-rich CWC family protein [Cohnella xylanilytica]|uniref:Cysteine-rich CWC family protein n=1 Tax=Cohnella xylanilytica TaxID=557555 RepID=A0A841UBT8_9BACL|nr:cysteine-rich CWC family protein [Cohnella xylanilytica]MBB6695380.1 cysteine-rich CWC family protein [Cohnella xylanilytica]